MIKNYSFKILTLVGLIVILNSCQKKVLELESYNSFSDQSAYTTPERVELAVNGAYDAAQSGFYAGGVVRGYPFGSARPLIIPQRQIMILCSKRFTR